MMARLMPIRVAHIYRYPVKGLTPEPLARVAIAPGQGLPHDRRFALAHGTTRFDPAAPEWLPKSNFLMLMKNERLARLKTHFDAESGILAIERDGRKVAGADITQPAGRLVIEQFFAAFMGVECRGMPRLVEAPGHMFSDTPPKVVSLIGLDSIRDLERVTRAPVDHRRFRANLYVAGAAPWQEFDWVGRELSIGATRLRVVKRIERCAATNVNPDSAARDMNLPRSLRLGFDHVDMGVYAEVVQGGAIAVGDSFAPPA
ncbi:MAG TPA: MOSC domain-containing protein [Alphaproteobacteria bacterium]|nr:MOSC domain-containing protein [Alphaproteobacteria bacterium]